MRGEMIRVGSRESLCELKIYDSLLEAIDASVAYGKKGGHQNPVSDNYRNSSWVGMHFNDLNDLSHKAKSIWTEGIKIVEEMLDELKESSLPKPTSIRRRRKWDANEGDAIDLDRMRSGQEFFRRAVRQKVVTHSSVTIIADLGANSSVHHKKLLWRGAAAIALTHLLEEAGYRVELWGAEYATRTFTDGVGNLYAYRLKEVTQPLNISSLATCVSGWFFRTIGFGSIGDSLEGRTPTAGIGQHVDFDDTHADYISHDPNRIIMQGVWDKRDAIELIRETIAGLEK